ncbi:zingipain-2 [Selaginella moellendorffii]|uniref:zingipain-2 n=1 Tax=Selaginella moellendorffii TaxID=88036 RepID=UPI000D1CBE47|nr:zingipain-2 [Selaginella moellendorffii]|eukprot:XP_024545824.1 zingipain-2 [Selaginella moellendorffii]
MALSRRHVLLALLACCFTLVVVAAAFPHHGRDEDREGPNFWYAPEELDPDAGFKFMFDRWRAEHSRVYAERAEEERKFELFKRNVRMLHDYYRNLRLYWLGLDHLPDLDHEEFKPRLPSRVASPVLRTKVDHSDEPPEPRRPPFPHVPEAVDWRKEGAVTSVKDVGNCTGGGWAFATAGAVEGLNKIVTGNLVELSAQELIDCDVYNGGCDYGFPQDSFVYIQKTGLEASASYPYIGKNSTCHIGNPYKVFIDGFDTLRGSLCAPGVSASDIEEELKMRVAQQPVTALIDGSSKDFVKYTGGIFKGPCHSTGDTGLTAVLIVGYGSDNGDDYWILKNSRGTKWGEQGYMKIQRGTGLYGGRCGINNYVFFPRKF